MNSPSPFSSKYEGLFRVKLDVPELESSPSQKVSFETERSVVRVIVYSETSEARRRRSFPCQAPDGAWHKVKIETF